MAQNDKEYDKAFELMADEAGLSDKKIMGVFGAMRRGTTKESLLVET